MRVASSAVLLFLKKNQKKKSAGQVKKGQLNFLIPLWMFSHVCLWRTPPLQTERSFDNDATSCFLFPLAVFTFLFPILAHRFLSPPCKIVVYLLTKGRDHSHCLSDKERLNNGREMTVLCGSASFFMQEYSH